MTLLHPWSITIGASLLLACGPSAEDLDDVYPRNCGVEGPVDLFEGSLGSYADVRRAGDHYVVMRMPDAVTLEHWAVDRCGEERVLLHEGPDDSSLWLGVGGEHVLSCEEATGAMAYIDPTGAEPPRPLFPAGVEGCRVVPLGKGLAAQERQGGTVWFHPDPADPEQEAVVVTREAQVGKPEWTSCWGLELDCESWHPLGLSLRAAGEELLVALESEELLAFSSTSLASRILDPGPVQALDVLPGGRRIVVDRHLERTHVVDRLTGDSFEFCCWSDWEPIRLFGAWVVQGSFGSPLIPEPPQWVNFEAYHLPTGQRTVIEGRERWSVLAPLTDDTALVSIGPHDSNEAERYVVWLATGERQPVDLPGEEMWAAPGRNGVFTTGVDDEAQVLRYLAGPGQEPRILLEDVHIRLATTEGRIVFERAGEPGEPGPLSVMLPDERVIVLEEHALGAFSPSYWGERWPLDRDEVLYGVQDGDGWVLRRTVLP